MDGDCFTIAGDSCDPKRLYLVNEEVYDPSDTIAQLYLSTDAGQSWTTTYAHHALFLSGSFATTRDALFMGTVSNTSNSVFRSIDRGITWKSIGGPSVGPDTRNLAAINANIVLAIDQQGNIWRTTNGGGDSVATAPAGSFAVHPAELFATDTLDLCNAPVLDTIAITASACIWPHVLSEKVTGADSNDYTIVHAIPQPLAPSDSVQLSFVPSDTGVRKAMYELTLDDGTIIQVPLDGRGRASHVLSLSSSSTNEKTDTIGGTVAVPIELSGLARAEDVTVVLHYPLQDLEYAGSFDTSGVPVDIPGEQWPASPTIPGRSKLKIVGAAPGATVPQAYARFRVFSDSNYEPKVTFDSVQVLTAIAPCEYLLPQPTTASIIPLEGCGRQMLSRWVHLGESPRFSIRPNPTNGAIELRSSMDVGDATVTIFDMLGTVRGEFLVTLAKNSPATFSLPFENGVYYARITSQMGKMNLPIVISK